MLYKRICCVLYRRGVKNIEFSFLRSIVRPFFNEVYKTYIGEYKTEVRYSQEEISTAVLKDRIQATAFNGRSIKVSRSRRSLSPATQQKYTIDVKRDVGQNGPGEMTILRCPDAFHYRKGSQSIHCKREQNRRSRENGFLDRGEGIVYFIGPR